MTDSNIIQFLENKPHEKYLDFFSPNLIMINTHKAVAGKRENVATSASSET